MSGGEQIANLVGATLGHPVIGRELLAAAADTSGISEAELTDKMDHPPGWWSRITAGRRLHVVAVQAALVEHAAEGRLVYHGHAGHLLLEGVPKVLRVRVIAPRSRRVGAVMKQQHLDQEAAERYVRHVDDERARWTKLIYGVDWSDPTLYDVVVNLEQVTAESAADAISELARKPEMALDSATRKTLADLRVACRVKLALATNPTTRSIDCHVRADEGRVEVSCMLPRVGVVPTARDHLEAQIRKTAGSVDGVEQVRLDLHSVYMNG
jgi:hypothetical protein